MIQIHINPTCVERVLFVASTDVEEDFDFAAWQAIRPIVDKIDQRLKLIATGIKEANSGESGR